ncbi:hypothetical protein L596_015877 [Steinernema carpocapsae]|uniref:Uncharacterized protein n=1 Tax=Steinernema carpocapsae TaxID=34508 RepID=A0A4U5NGX6_STECR|nr:hypothetical protein L596_015877 [Steinernema carpocapsae]
MAQISVFTSSSTDPLSRVIFRDPSFCLSTLLTCVRLCRFTGPFSMASVSDSLRVWSNVRRTLSLRISRCVSDPRFASTPASSTAM